MHGSVFGRIEVIRVVKGQIERLRLHESAVRDRVAKVSTLKHLQDLYEKLACYAGCPHIPTDAVWAVRMAFVRVAPISGLRSRIDYRSVGRGVHGGSTRE